MTRSGPMDPADWAAVNAVFHKAIDLPPEERATFIDRECAGHPDLRAEALSLLASHDRANTFLESGAVNAHVPRTSGLVDPLVGRRVGHYEIERVLGAGGMGIVYLARDTKLGRTVALKSLPAEFAHDPSRRERLAHEARAAAALTHPGIAIVYALEEIDDRLFIATEHVVGQTLREQLSAGPLSPADAVQTAGDVAHALAAAHRAGVVHRDLKPENVMRSDAGAVKILDFGLARALTPSGPSLTPLTAEGRVFGTPAYMAPEQVRGADVGFAADHFSFGVLVYELLTATNPFAGPDPASTIARILEFSPPPVAERVPAAFARAAGVADLGAIVDRCLQKDAARRFASTDDLLAAIDRVGRGEAQPAGHAVWWWRFHQATASLATSALLVPLGFADERLGRPLGMSLFVAALVAAIVATTLRLHLWFATRSYPEQWRRQRRDARVWIRAADITYVAAMAISGIALLGSSRVLALVLIGAAVLVFLAFTLIEPATERAAFGSKADEID